MRIRYATFSETGRRYANQDVFRVEQISEGDATLMVVCDGMGGHAMGDVAAETVCNAVFDNWRRVSDDNMEDKIVEICRIVSKIFDERVVSMNYIQMGTTFVMAYIKDDVATIAHIGDSRCYLLRGRDVVYQTKDHVGVENGREGISKCFFSYRPDVAVPVGMNFACCDWNDYCGVANQVIYKLVVVWYLDVCFGFGIDFPDSTS